MPNLDHEFSYITLPRINVVGRSPNTAGEIEFDALLDTGADVTILDEFIALRLGLDLDKLPKIRMRGIGGGSTEAPMAEIQLLLLGEEELSIDLQVAFVTGIADALDNLIGRDVLEFIDFSLEHSKRTGYLGRTEAPV